MNVWYVSSILKPILIEISDQRRINSTFEEGMYYTEKQWESDDSLQRPITEAMKHGKWLTSMKEEFWLMKKYNVWKLIELPEDRRITIEFSVSHQQK